MPVTSIFTTRNAAGDIIAQRFVYDDGKELENFYDGGVLTRSVLSDLGDVEDYTTVERTYDAAGNITEQTLTPDTGDIATTTYDIAGNIIGRRLTDRDDSSVWETLEETFDAAGNPLTRELTLDSGRIIFDTYDASGNTTSTRQTDAGDEAGWDVIETVFDTAGNVISRTVIQDNGVTVAVEYSGGVETSRTVTDPTAGQPGGPNYTEIRSEFDANGDLERSITLLDNGDTLIAEYSGGQLVSRRLEDTDDDAGWDAINTLFNAAGQRFQVETFFDNGNIDVNRLINTAPVARDFTFSDPGLNEDDTITETIPPFILTDADGDAISIQSFGTAGLQGSLTDNGNGSYTYDPNGQFESLAVGETDTTSFTYTIVDSYNGPLTPTSTRGFGATDTGTVTLQIEGRNDDPVAVDDAYTVGSGDVLTITDPALGLLANDTDVDASDTLAVDQTITTGTVGTPVVSSNGTFSYDPNGQFAGLSGTQTATDTFTYEVDDGNGGTDTATVTITVTGDEDPIVITGDTTGDVAEDGTLTDSGTLVASDADANDTPTFTAQTGTAGTYGTFDLNASGDWDYTLDNIAAQALAGGETFDETFTAVATTTDGETASQTVTVTVTGEEDPLRIFGFVAKSLGEDNYLPTDTESIIARDQDDVDDPTFVPQSNVAGAYFTFGVTADGEVTASKTAAIETLAQDQNVTDVFTVTATTADGETATRDLRFGIFGDNDAPVLAAAMDFGSASENVGSFAVSPFFFAFSNRADDIDNDDDASTLTYTYSNFSDPAFEVLANGNLALIIAGNFEELDDGESTTLTADVVATDRHGATSNTGTISFRIDGRNDAPVVAALTETVSEQDPLATFDLLSGQTDVDAGDTLSAINITAADSGGNAVAFTDNNDGTISIDPNLFDGLETGETETVTVSYDVSDGTADVANTLTITVNGFTDNGAPVANDDVISGSFIFEDNSGFIFASFLLSNDSDPDLDMLQITGVDATSAQGIPLSVLTDGNISFDADAVDALDALPQGQTLADSFTYTISDGNGGTDTATVSLTITGLNDAASIAGDTTGAVTEDTLLFATGTLTVTDVDTGEAGAQVQGNTAADNGYGVYSVDADGNWSYGLFASAAIVQALPGSTSVTDTFTVTSIDGTASETVTITVNGTNDLASISGDTTGTVTEDGNAPATGTLTVSDIDDGESAAQVETDVASNAGFGTVSVTAAGVWTFTLDDRNSGVDALDDGGTLTDSFTVVSSDGTASETVNITINGVTDPIPFLINFSDIGTSSGSNVVPLNGTYRGFTWSSGSGANIGEPFVFDSTLPTFSNWANLGGNVGATSFSRDPLIIAEVDGDDFFFDSIDLAADVGDGGTVTITGFNDGVPVGTQTATITDTGLTTIDAEFSGLIDTLQISGYPGDVAFDNISLIRPDSVNAATISGDLTGTVSEDGVLTATGVLTVADGDAGENFIEPDSFSNPEGTFSINAFNEWTFTLNNSNPAIQALETGQSINVGLGYGSADGSVAGFVTITINGLDEGSTQTTVDFESTSIGVLPTNFEGFDWVVSAAFPSLIVQENLDNTTWDNLQTKTALTSGEASAVTVTQENGDNFEFVSIDLQGSDDAASTVTLLGFVDGAQTESQTFTLSNTTMNTFTPTGWSDIDELRIEGYQTTPGGVPQGDIAIDNFIFA